MKLETIIKDLEELKKRFWRWGVFKKLLQQTKYFLHFNLKILKEVLKVWN